MLRNIYPYTAYLSSPLSQMASVCLNVHFSNLDFPLSFTVLRCKERIYTNCYKFKTKYGSFVTLRSQWFSFVNPWTKEVEYIVSTNTVIS